MGIRQELRQIIAKKKKENDIREIQMKTEINMKVWEKGQKKESLFDKLFRWFK